jgi:hypothetical protein
LALAERVADAEQVAQSLVALHATDPASVFLSVAARMHQPPVPAVEQALYEDRTLVRMLGMRRTVFVVPVDLVPVVHASSTRAIATRERRRLIQMLEEGSVASDPAKWLGQVEDKTVQALEAEGEATGAELSALVPELRTQLSFGEGTKWQGTQALTTRILFLLAADGRIVRGRPRGSWISSQYRWAPMASWLPGGTVEPSVHDAQARLVRQWLQGYGPGTSADVKWWTGWTGAEVNRALTRIGAVEVELDSGTGYVLPDDMAPVRAAPPWAALLPALDPTVMGWTGRSWYLSDDGKALFDRSGNPGPTVWWDGRIVGGWAQRHDGEIVWRLLEDIGADAVAAVEAAAEQLAGWLGPVRVKPRFRTAIERQLTQ